MASIGAVPKRPPPSLDPQNIVRSIVWVQNAVRWKIAMKRMRASGKAAEADLRSPALATANQFCGYLLRPERVDVENEAMGVAAIICGRDSMPPEKWRVVRGLTLGTLAAAYDYYAPKLAAGHPVLGLFQERFREVAIDVEEDVIAAIGDATLPSVAMQRMDERRKAWGAPSVFPGGKPEDEIFPHIKDLIRRLQGNAERIIAEQLPVAMTRASLDALAAAVERELGGTATGSRKRVREALERHREHMEATVQNAFGWPPNGTFKQLARAVRTFAIELGADNIVVEDFAAVTLRLLRKFEATATAELSPLEADAIRLRKLLNADPSPPKLLADGYQDELDETLFNANKALEHWDAVLGLDSEVYVQHLRNITDTGPFLARCNDETKAAAAELRRIGPAQDPAQILFERPESPDVVESRMVAAVSLSHLIESLRDNGVAHDAEPLAQEFAAELASVRPLIAMLRPGQEEEEEDDGWHKPPGFQGVDVPYVKPATPPPALPPPPVPPTLPQNHGDVKVGVRLHGVTLEDVRCHSEILLMEQLADIVAAECGIPREWVRHFGVKLPITEAPAVNQDMPADVEV